MVTPEQRVNLPVQVQGWRKKYELCRALLVPTSPSFAYASRVLK